MNEPLLPCPFCGTKAHTFKWFEYVAIGCDTDGCICFNYPDEGDGSSYTDIPANTYNAEEEAIKAWNTRKAPKNELQPLNISEFRNYCTDIGQPMSDYAASKICSKFGSSGKRPLNVPEVLKVLENIETVYLPENYDCPGCNDIDWTKTDLNTADAICKEFSTAEVSLETIEKALSPIPSTHVPISKMNGKTYYYMCKEDIAKALKAELERGE